VITKLLRKDIDLFFEVQMETPSRNSELQSPNWSFSPFAPCSPFSTKLICLLSEMPYWILHWDTPIAAGGSTITEEGSHHLFSCKMSLCLGISVFFKDWVNEINRRWRRRVNEILIRSTQIYSWMEAWYINLLLEFDLVKSLHSPGKKV
jgi:hypothetical protein